MFVFYSGCCLVLKTRTVPNHFVNMILKALKKELTNEVFDTNCLLFHLSVLLLFVHFVFLADPFSFEYPPPLHTVLVHLKYFNCEYFKYFNCEYFRYFFVAYSLLPHLAREIFWLKNQFLSGFGSTSFVSISKLSSHLLSILLSAEHWKPKHWDRSGGWDWVGTTLYFWNSQSRLCAGTNFGPDLQSWSQFSKFS